MDPLFMLPFQWVVSLWVANAGFGRRFRLKIANVREKNNKSNVHVTPGVYRVICVGKHLHLEALMISYFDMRLLFSVGM